MRLVARGRQAMLQARQRPGLKSRTSFLVSPTVRTNLARIAVLYHTWRGGRDLGEVHHVNGCFFDDRLSNLTTLTPAEHQRRHKAKDMRFRLCPGCWSLFVTSGKWPAEVFCSHACYVRSAGGRWRGRPTVADWMELSWSEYLRGAAAPPPPLAQLRGKRMMKGE
jgi:hypothetical protein